MGSSCLLPLLALVAVFSVGCTTASDLTSEVVQLNENDRPARINLLGSDRDAPKKHKKQVTMGALFGEVTQKQAPVQPKAPEQPKPKAPIVTPPAPAQTAPLAAPANAPKAAKPAAPAKAPGAAKP